MGLFTKRKHKAKMTFIVRQEVFKRFEVVTDDYLEGQRQAIENFQSKEPDWRGEIFTELGKIEQIEK